MQVNVVSGLMLWLLELSWPARLLVGGLIGAVIGGPTAAVIPMLWSKGSSGAENHAPINSDANRMGSISGNSGIVSQGQIGDNKIAR